MQTDSNTLSAGPYAQPNLAVRARPQFPRPPDHFDPLTASNEALDHYGIPRPPDAHRTPQLHAAWRRFFQPPVAFVDPELRFVEALARSPQRLTLVQLATRVSNSENWAGAMIIPNGGRQCVLLFGEWTVPDPAVPPIGERGPVGVDDVYTCSCWIGLDGARQYLNSSLPQIGTTQSITVKADGSTSVSCNAFFQWWAATQTTLNYATIASITVSPGDQMIALLWAIDPFNVVVMIRKKGAPSPIASFLKSAPQIKLRDGSLGFPKISGATAEWIVERPRPLQLDATTFDQFADYGRVGFTSCVAGTAQSAGLPDSEEVLTAPVLLRMYEVPSGPPSRTKLISMPKKLSATSLDVSYGGFDH